MCRVRFLSPPPSSFSPPSPFDRFGRWLVAGGNLSVERGSCPVKWRPGMNGNRFHPLIFSTPSRESSPEALEPICAGQPSHPRAPTSTTPLVSFETLSSLSVTADVMCHRLLLLIFSCSPVCGACCPCLPPIVAGVRDRTRRGGPPTSACAVILSPVLFMLGLQRSEGWVDGVPGRG